MKTWIKEKEKKIIVIVKTNLIFWKYFFNYCKVSKDTNVQGANSSVVRIRTQRFLVRIPPMAIFPFGQKITIASESKREWKFVLTSAICAEQVQNVIADAIGRQDD